MGGFGSGRWPRNERKLLVNECHSIDIRMWKKQGWLEPSTTITYGHGLHVQVYKGEIELQFASADGVTVADGRQHSYTEYVNIHRQECHFGGKRPAFVCPSCRRRSFILYQSHGYYRCRSCCNLAHASQSECSHYRMINRAYKLLRLIHKDACLMLPIPEKPKGMHGITYRRIVREIEHIRGHVSPVLNIRESFADLFSNIPELNQIDNLQLGMPELEMLGITNFNLVDL
jgi:hypothetical protein